MIKSGILSADISIDQLREMWILWMPRRIVILKFYEKIVGSSEG